MNVWQAWPAQLGAVGILGLVVLAIIFGRLVPRSATKQLLEQAELRVQLADRNADRWEKAAEASDKRADVFSEQLSEVLAAMHSVEALVRSLPSRRDEP